MDIRFTKINLYPFENTTVFISMFFIASSIAQEITWISPVGLTVEVLLCRKSLGGQRSMREVPALLSSIAKPGRCIKIQITEHLL